MASPIPSDLHPGDENDLLRAAHAAATFAHAPYSGTRVGAALLCADGQVFTGCNVENASLGLTLCAERVAVVKAVSAGQQGLVALAIASDGDHPLTPCGACRQVLAEFAGRLTILSQGSEGPRLRTTLAELLPRPFTGEDAGLGRDVGREPS